MAIIEQELTYIFYYFSAQLSQIFWYWVVGMIIGSVVSVFFKDKIHSLMKNMTGNNINIAGIIIRSIVSSRLRKSISFI